MCGIAGLIGRPKKPKLSHELMTKLFDFLELRGTDASGVWGVESTGEHRIVYHKEPVRSSQFVKHDIWQQTGDLKPDLLLLHARAASTGWAKDNINNHPFVSQNRQIAMVHNGRIDEADYLCQQYEMLSDTDSEIILRMYEAGLGMDFETMPDVPDDVACRLTGINEIWSHVANGAMSVAIGERVGEHDRYLFLFHNALRPLWTIDLRERLGQIVFFSSPDIWYKATSSISSTLLNVLREHEKLVEVPKNQIWVFHTNEQNPIVTDENIHKFEVEVTDEVDEWKPDEKIPVQSGESSVQLITGLDKNDLVLEEGPTNEEKDLFLPGNNHHKGLCDDIRCSITNIEWHMGNYLNNGSITRGEYDEIVEDLIGTANHLRGTLELLRNRG